MLKLVGTKISEVEFALLEARTRGAGIRDGVAEWLFSFCLTEDELLFHMDLGPLPDTFVADYALLNKLA